MSVWIDPVVVEVKQGLRSLLDCLGDLKALGDDQRNGIAERLIAKQRGQPNRVDARLAVAIERALADYAADGDLPVGLLHQALIMKEVSAFVRIRAHSLYAVKPPSWFAPGSPVNVYESILTGTLQLNKGRRQRDIDGGLNGASLLLKASEFKELLGDRMPSEKALKATKDQIVRDFVLKYGEEAQMLQREFIAAVLQIHPSCTKKHAENICWPLVPKHWRRQGRRSRKRPS